MNVKRLYAAEDVENSIKDGSIAYPSPDLNEKMTPSGMGFDLQYAFLYTRFPKTKSHYLLAT